MRILNVRDNNHMHTAANGMASNTASASLSHDRESEQDVSPRLSLAPALAGPGTTRANRRLQLRKNGFRGKEVQQPSVTPNRTSGSWPPSPVNDLGALLDGSSESKMHDRSHDYNYNSQRRSSILQEVNNSTSLRRSRARPRTDLVSIFMDENVGGEIGDSSRESSWGHGKMDSSPAWSVVLETQLYEDKLTRLIQSPCRCAKPHQKQEEATTITIRPGSRCHDGGERAVH